MRKARIDSKGRLSPAQWLLSLHSQSIRTYTGILMVLMVLLLSAASASPQLHEWLHGWHQDTCCQDDPSDTPVHQHHGKSLSCAVVLMGSGVTPMVADIPLPIPTCVAAVFTEDYQAPLINTHLTAHGARAPPEWV